MFGRHIAAIAFVSIVTIAAHLTIAAQTRPQAGQPETPRPAVPAAPAASAQRGPDVLGIYSGMPLEEARARIQSQVVAREPLVADPTAHAVARIERRHREPVAQRVSNELEALVHRGSPTKASAILAEPRVAV